MRRGALALVMLGLAWPLPARAHGALRRSSPAANARLDSVPVVLRLTFTEAPVLGFTRITLLDSAGGEVAIGGLRLDSTFIVVAPIVGRMGAGRYTVRWQVASADGHPVRGEYAFRIAAGAAGLGPPADTVHGEPAGILPVPGVRGPPPEHHPAEGGFDAGSWQYVVIRWLSYAGMLLVIGSAAFRYAVLPRYRRLEADPTAEAQFVTEAVVRAARIGQLAAGILVIAGLLRLAAQSYAVHGAAGALAPALVGSMLLRTVWGWSWLAQMLLAIALIVAFQRGRRVFANRAWAAAGILAVMLAYTPAFAGHAVAAPRWTAPAIVLDGLHVLGAAGWLGSLAVLLVAGIPAAAALGSDRRGRAVAHLVNAFSPTALIFAGLVAATGVLAASIHLGGLAPLWTSTYGKTLLLKLAVLSAVAATGAYNWRRVRPVLGDDRGTHRIRRSATVEVLVALLVILITAILVATPTPVAVATTS